MNYFDKQAQSWDNDPRRVERAQVTFEAIKSRVALDPETKCMEFGCGTGVLSFQFQPLVRSIDLVDTSAGMLEVLRTKIADFAVENMTPVFADYTHIDPAKITAQYHLIYTLMTLHHVLDYTDLLTVLYRSLLPGGYLCIADLVEEDGSFHQHSPEFEGHNGFNCEMLQQKMEGAGFSEVSWSVYYNVLKEERTYPLFLMVGRK